VIVEEPTACAVAEAARSDHGVPPDYARVASERRIIELCEGTGAATLVSDVPVWIVRFASGARWAELAVDASSGNIVRVQRSRGR
jgi:hypothetical protein